MSDGAAIRREIIRAHTRFYTEYLLWERGFGDLIGLRDHWLALQSAMERGLNYEFSDGKVWVQVYLSGRWLDTDQMTPAEADAFVAAAPHVRRIKQEEEA